LEFGGRAVCLADNGSRNIEEMLEGLVNFTRSLNSRWSYFLDSTCLKARTFGTGSISLTGGLSIALTRFERSAGHKPGEFSRPYRNSAYSS